VVYFKTGSFFVLHQPNDPRKIEKGSKFFVMKHKAIFEICGYKLPSNINVYSGLVNSGSDLYFSDSEHSIAKIQNLKQNGEFEKFVSTGPIQKIDKIHQFDILSNKEILVLGKNGNLLILTQKTGYNNPDNFWSSANLTPFQEWQVSDCLNLKIGQNCKFGNLSLSPKQNLFAVSVCSPLLKKNFLIFGELVYSQKNQNFSLKILQKIGLSKFALTS
jgi:hypothetical protein